MSTSERLKTVLLFGAPGVGKGTQGKVIGAIAGFYHSACGDVFRQVDVHSELGKIFFKYSSRGELVPDDVTIRMWHKAICAHIVLSHYKPHSDLLVLDGIPRTCTQAELMEQHVEVLKIVHLTCDDPKAMFDRLYRRARKEGRHDDTDEQVIKRRWNVYEQETRPVLAHYPADLIEAVNAIGTPSQVLAQVLKVLAPIQSEQFGLFDG